MLKVLSGLTSWLAEPNVFCGLMLLGIMIGTASGYELTAMTAKHHHHRYYHHSYQTAVHRHYPNRVAVYGRPLYGQMNVMQYAAKSPRYRVREGFYAVARPAMYDYSPSDPVMPTIVVPAMVQTYNEPDPAMCPTCVFDYTPTSWLGADPDPNIRMQLLHDAMYVRHAGGG
jgi:hypothetical protein